MGTLQIVLVVALCGIFAFAVFSFVKSLIRFIKSKKEQKLEKENKDNG